MTLLSSPDIGLLSRTARELLLSLVLSSVRAVPILIILPLVAQYNIPTGFFTTGLAIGISIPVMPEVYTQILLFGIDDFTVAFVLALSVKEMLLGTILVLPLSIPFWGAAVAGEVVEQMAGLGASADNRETGGAFSTYFTLLLSIVLLENDWFREVLLQRYYESYLLWPVISMAPEVSMASGFYLLQVLDVTMEVAMVIALPLLGMFFLVDTTTGLAFKYTPQFNPMMEASGYKTLLLVIVLPAFSAVFLAHADRYLASLFTALADLAPFITMDQQGPN